MSGRSRPSQSRNCPRRARRPLTFQVAMVNGMVARQESGLPERGGALRHGIVVQGGAGRCLPARPSPPSPLPPPHPPPRERGATALPVLLEIPKQDPPSPGEGGRGGGRGGQGVRAGRGSSGCL